MVCGPASTLSLGSLLEMRISGPIPDLMNQSLHFYKVPSDWHAHSSLRNTALITSKDGTKVSASLQQERFWSAVKGDFPPGRGRIYTLKGYSGTSRGRECSGSLRWLGTVGREGRTVDKITSCGVLKCPLAAIRAPGSG